MQILIILGLGGITGIFSGLFGIGGGIILVPLLMFVLGYSQATASGTSLVALLLPVGLLGAVEYYRAGKIAPEHIRYGFMIAAGIFVGAFFGAKLATILPTHVLRKALSIFLAGVAIKVWFT